MPIEDLTVDLGASLHAGEDRPQVVALPYSRAGGGGGLSGKDGAKADGAQRIRADIDSRLKHGQASHR